MEAKYPDLLTLGLPKAEAVLEISFEETSGDLRTADNAVKLLKREVEAEHPDASDRFEVVMKPFEARARKEVDAAATDIGIVSEDFKALAKRFAEGTSGKIDPAGFFGKQVRLARRPLRHCCHRRRRRRRRS